MLMCPDNGRIKLQFFQINLLKFCEDRGPTPTLGPAIETLIDHVPFAKTFRQIAPLDAGFQHEEDGINEEPIVLGGCTAVACLAGQQVLDPFVLLIAERMAGTRHGFFLHISQIDCQQNLGPAFRILGFI